MPRVNKPKRIGGECYICANNKNNIGEDVKQTFFCKINSAFKS